MLGKCYIVLGALSIIYFIGYLITAELNSYFCFFFLALGIFMIAMGTIHLLSQNEVINIPRWVHGIYHVCVAIAICVFAIVETFIIQASTTPPAEKADYVVVPGARIVGKVPTKDLKHRLNAAYDYWKDNPNTVIVLSGARVKGEKITEADAMQDYLEEKGVPNEQVLLDRDAENTSENAKNITNCIMEDSDIVSHKSKKMKDVKVVVATNSFHLYRVEKLLKKQGFKDVTGIGAKSKIYNIPLNYTREFFAVVWYKVKGLI